MGEGGVDALRGVLGMGGGDAIYAVAYPFARVDIIVLGHHGKINLAQVTGLIIGSSASY